MITDAIHDYVAGQLSRLWSLPKPQRRARLAELRRAEAQRPGAALPAGALGISPATCRRCGAASCRNCPKSSGAGKRRQESAGNHRKPSGRSTLP